MKWFLGNLMKLWYAAALLMLWHSSGLQVATCPDGPAAAVIYSLGVGMLAFGFGAIIAKLGD